MEKLFGEYKDIIQVVVKEIKSTTVRWGRSIFSARYTTALYLDKYIHIDGEIQGKGSDEHLQYL